MPDPKTAKPLRLVVAEGHALFRAGLRYLLQELADVVELHEAAALDDLSELLDAGGYDLILVDYLLGGPEHHLDIAGIRARAGGIPVAVISGKDDPSMIRAALEDGAAGFIPKDSSPRVMIQALRLILAGGIYLPPSILLLLPKAARQEPADPRRAPLTTRQQEVWNHLAQGASNKQIARSLGLSEGAVKAHVAGLLRLLGARNRTEALVRAAQAGWTDGHGATPPVG
ncbi:LuxR C-terminal-related transcriptional regulator [Consotaella salsifontis]|uniref:Two component transcriptional regulator, LuxR family n=1 Tax=Consotaella salsifontis TaxID=1365950 RepID=A0A1T4SF28_9HYPH|nr:response regulator transcription factor [Consotaella salsifontis]SKA26779.1 two component transcriptional regulator, LuxR family [Consotaella salsifontis]